MTRLQPCRHSAAVERAIAIGSPTDLIIAIVEEARARTQIPLTADETQRMNLAFGAAIAKMAATCEVTLPVLASACSLIVSAALEQHKSREQIEQFFLEQHVTIDSLRQYRQAQATRFELFGGAEPAPGCGPVVSVRREH